MHEERRQQTETDGASSKAVGGRWSAGRGGLAAVFAPPLPAFLSLACGVCVAPADLGF